jgi:hypothetical protein
MAEMRHDLPSTRRRKRQVHVFLSDREYEWLRNQALMRDDTISNVVRGLCFDKSVRGSVPDSGDAALQSAGSYVTPLANRRRMIPKSG